MPRIQADLGPLTAPSTLLERQAPLTAPVRVHDVSFETPVAVADEKWLAFDWPFGSVEYAPRI
jgi:hypothetical protein